MGLHGLMGVTLGVPNPQRTQDFYRDFGLAERSGGGLTGADGGELILVPSNPRRLLEVFVGADSADDVAQIARNAADSGIPSDFNDDVVTVCEPVTGIRYSVGVAGRVVSAPGRTLAANAPGATRRNNERLSAVVDPGPTLPRKLGHILLATTDLEKSKAFLVDVLGFKVSDSVPSIIEFLRCSTDHHNVALMSAPVSFLHHTAWQVDDLDSIGQGAEHLMATNSQASVWGLGRHFLGSNLFWYFRDPAGNLAEYYTDLDQIADDSLWAAQSWSADEALYAWGPPVPPDFLRPPEVDSAI